MNINRIVLITLAASMIWCGAIGQGEKARARLSLGFHKETDGKAWLNAEVKTKVDRSYEGVSGVMVHFYKGTEEQHVPIGKSMSDGDGVAKMTVPEESLRPDSGIVIDFYAAIVSDQNYRNADRSLQVRPSRFTMELRTESDTMKQVRIALSTMDSSGAWAPVQYVPVRLFVDRMFGLLPVNDVRDMTGADGTLLVTFPEDIPGDANGALELIARIDDHDEFGTLTDREMVQWGVPVTLANQMDDRELWSARSNVPIWLLVICNALILGIWGTIVYLIVQIYKIRTIGRQIAGSAEGST